MRRVWSLVILCMLMLLIVSGCTYEYWGLTEDPDEVWIASEPKLYLRYSESDRAIRGATHVKGEAIDVVIHITKNGAVDFFSYDGSATNKSYLGLPLASGALSRDAKGRASFEMFEEGNSLFPDCRGFKMTKYDISEVEWVDGWPVPIEG